MLEPVCGYLRALEPPLVLYALPMVLITVCMPDQTCMLRVVHRIRPDGVWMVAYLKELVNQYGSDLAHGAQYGNVD